MDAGRSLKDLLLYIARNLVENPDAVSVTEVEGDQELTLELRVAPEDMGKVIGRQGRIAKEIRTLVRSPRRFFIKKGDKAAFLTHCRPTVFDNRPGFLYTGRTASTSPRRECRREGELYVV